MSSYYVNKVLYRIKREKGFRALFLEDFEKALEGFELTSEEKEALKARNYRTLLRFGAKPMLLLPFAGVAKPGDMFTARGKTQ